MFSTRLYESLVARTGRISGMPACAVKRLAAWRRRVPSAAANRNALSEGSGGVCKSAAIQVRDSASATRNLMICCQPWHFSRCKETSHRRATLWRLAADSIAKGLWDTRPLAFPALFVSEPWRTLVGESFQDFAPLSEFWRCTPVAHTGDGAGRAQRPQLKKNFPWWDKKLTSQFTFISPSLGAQMWTTIHTHASMLQQQKKT